MFVAPSPKKQATTLPVFRSFIASAYPEAIGIPPPTMAVFSVTSPLLVTYVFGSTGSAVSTSSNVRSVFEC